MEKTSRRGILGRHQSCDSERIDILSDSIECHHLSRKLPAYCIPKVVRLKNGEVLYDKVYMSPRPPPKISLKHEWTRESGSKVARQPEGEVARQPEGEVARQAKFFQPTQPTPNPIRDRSGRPDDMQDGRNTSRSQEINVNSFNEELSSSDRTGRPVETEIIQTRSSEDSKSLNVEQTHDRTERPVATLHTAEAQDSSRVCSAHENVDDEVLRKRMAKSIAVHDENHEPMMVNEADMDFRIPGLPHSVVKYAQSTSVRQLIQKIENHPDRHALQKDLRQNQSFNPFSPESKQMIRDVGNIELCELLEPKTQCKVCLSYWNIGIFYCTCGHFLHKEREANQHFTNFSMDLLSVPEYVIKKGLPHGHGYGKKPGDKEYHTADQLKKRCKKEYFQRIHDRFIRDPGFRNRMIENLRDEELCRKWDALDGPLPKTCPCSVTDKAFKDVIQENVFVSSSASRGTPFWPRVLPSISALIGHNSVGDGGSTASVMPIHAETFKVHFHWLPLPHPGASSVTVGLLGTCDGCSSSTVLRLSTQTSIHVVLLLFLRRAGRH